MVEGVRNDGVLGTKENLEDPPVCVKTGGEQDGVIAAQVLRDPVFEGEMLLLRPTDKPHRRQSVAPLVQRLFTSRHNARIVGKPQVVVCAEVERPPRKGLHEGALRAHQRTLFFVQASITNALQLRGDLLFVGVHLFLPVDNDLACLPGARGGEGVLKLLRREAVCNHGSQCLTEFR